MTSSSAPEPVSRSLSSEEAAAGLCRVAESGVTCGSLGPRRPRRPRRRSAIRQDMDPTAAAVSCPCLDAALVVEGATYLESERIPFSVVEFLVASAGKPLRRTSGVGCQARRTLSRHRHADFGGVPEAPCVTREYPPHLDPGPSRSATMSAYASRSSSRQRRNFRRSVLSSVTVSAGLAWRRFPQGVRHSRR